LSNPVGALAHGACHRAPGVFFLVCCGSNACAWPDMPARPAAEAASDMGKSNRLGQAQRNMLFGSARTPSLDAISTEPRLGNNGLTRLLPVFKSRTHTLGKKRSDITGRKKRKLVCIQLANSTIFHIGPVLPPERIIIYT